VFRASFVDLSLGLNTVLAALAFGSRMAMISAVEAEHFLALIPVKAATSAFESFENATGGGNVIVHFAVIAAVFFIVVFVSSEVSAEISPSMPSFISSSSALAMSTVVTVENGSS